LCSRSPDGLVAALATATIVLGAPRLFGDKADRARGIARTEAIAVWAELIRDNMAGAAGLEQALLASANVCPQAIEVEVWRFARRLEHEPLGDALAALGDDLNHPSSDLVVAALANAARMEGRDIGALLSRLAESIRADVRMRLRVEVGRARIRTSARIVIGVTLFTMLFMYVFSRSLLEAYDSPAGQAWLVLVFAIFALGLWLMNTYGQVEMPERFSARRHGDRHKEPRP
jgi:tight adherence protein B